MSAALQLTPHPSEPARRPLQSLAADLGYSSDWNWAWNSYKAFVTALSAEYGLRRHLEIGGGRDPLFTPAEALSRGLTVTLNDISAAELSRAPSAFAKVCCDIAGPDTMASLPADTYDLVYSRMVMEHVADARQLWENQHALLRDGGVALAFYPTLYAPAFALNRIVPERLSSALLKRLFPDRQDDGDNPKFPALYSHCYGDEAKLAPMLRAIGFREVLVLPFYGYSYFWKIPVLRGLDAAFTRFVRARDLRLFTSFAYLVAVK